MRDKWRAALQELEEEQKSQGVQLQWCLVEGFVLYWDQVGCLKFCADPSPSSTP